MPQAACNKSAQEINSSLVHQHQLRSLHHRALGLPCSKGSCPPWEEPRNCASGSCGMWLGPCPAELGMI